MWTIGWTRAQGERVEGEGEGMTTGEVAEYNGAGGGRDGGLRRVVLLW